MGFGTLFIGYFLLLNITNYPVSDALAGLVMLLGLMRLASVNKKFAYARWGAVVFTAFGFVELLLFLLDLLLPHIIGGFYGAAFGYFAVARSLILAAFTVLLLGGIEDVSREVGVEKIPHRARVLTYASLVIYALFALLDVPFGAWMPELIRSVLFLTAIALILLLHIVVLVTVYGCYMQICMPGEENGKRKKPSRFKFVNDIRARNEEKEREMEEYRREQLKARKERAASRERARKDGKRGKRK